ncbi:ATP-binding SpoIIE family protein phosphatase [Streptomyces mirabilis]|uniref:ATP-binding SpoIIE family protein phosphatase n=1 Tax=Streptomyces mirabilis TaxID=68239 RepID=UPI0033E16398
MHRTGGPPDRRTGQPGEAHVDESVTIAVTDGDGRVAYWSREAQDLLGHTPAEIIGRPLDKLLSTDGTTFRHRDGSPLVTRAHLSPLLGATQQEGFLVTTVPSPGTGKLQDLMWWTLEQQALSLSIYDRDGRLLWANEATRRAVGFLQSEVRGRRLTEYLQGSAFEEAERRILRVGETGEPEYTELFVALPREPRAHAWAVDIFPLKDANNRVHAVVANDYSEQHHSRERMALLSEARTRIGASLDVRGTAQELVDVTVTVSRFADFVSVDLLEDVFHGALPGPGPHTGPVALRRAAQGSTHPLPPDAMLGIGTLHTHPQSSPLARCQVTGRPVLGDVKDPDITRWLAEDPIHAAYAHAFGTHSLLAVPIRARGVILGAALFLRDSASPDSFGPDDLTVIEDLVARVAVCLDNARRFTHERGIALTLQRSLLPRGPTVHPAVETASRYVPAGGSAGVGGDWFDVIPLPGARVGLVVGDVVGHGISASATMGRLRTAVRTLADIDLAPDELLTHLDDIVTHSGLPQDVDDADDVSDSEIPGDVGATCLYAVYDPVSSTCSLARAGHPPPILVGPDGTARVVDLPVGPPLGLGSLPFEAAEFTVPEGSLLALFTDGLIESRRHDLDEGNRSLCRALARPEPSLEALCDTVLDTQHPAVGGDDVALLLIRARALGPESLASWDLPSDPAIVAEARKRTCDRLSEWGLGDTSFVTELVVSELVTNAIRYGAGPIRLRLIKDRTLTCEVSDGSSTSPHLRRARLSDEGGRGLLLVAQLTERWGTRHTRTGKTIWAEQLIPTS